MSRLPRRTVLVHTLPPLPRTLIMTWLAAGVLASLGPARRALRINPTDALREA